MSGGVVRSSKFRHVFGTEARKENCYEGFRPTNCAFDGNFIAANQYFVAFCVEVGGAGAFCVIPVNKTGRLDINLPKITGHKEYVLDIKWNPFNDNMLASCSEDGSVRLWEIGEHGVLTNKGIEDALVSLEYHQKRCVQISWHPVANNVLMSVSQEPKICIWNLDEGTADVEIDTTSIIYNADWSSKGDKIVASFKDKMIRIFNARSGDQLSEIKGHEGSKAQRVVFTFNDTMLFSTGFSRMSERQFSSWKINGNEITNVLEETLDTTNGVLVPYYDPDTQMIYLAAKGDTAIRYYEITESEPYYYFITMFSSKDSQRSLCHIPKRSVDVNTCEVMRFYKMISSSKMIKPVTFTVPRKSDLFQDDLYPAAISDTSACEAEDWFAGTDCEPLRVDMSTFFKGKQKPKGAASGGGLKKGGLKGLKAKKSAKEADKKEAPAVKKETPAASEVETKPSTVSKSPSSEPTSTKVASSSSPVGSSADSNTVKKLQDEIKLLKDNEKKMQKDIKVLTDKLKDYDKLTGDIKLLCDAVKKNDERLHTLEALVQEESENEAEE